MRRILKLCDGVRPREDIFASSPLPADRTEQVLSRLIALGLVRSDPPPPQENVAVDVAVAVPVAAAPAAAPAPAPPLADFTDDEERFFASSIDHLVEDL